MMECTDGELLKSFFEKRDERAFEELAKRHSSLVMGVCRRTLNHSPEADEAFQNTFIVVSRKGESMTGSISIGGWLYQIALRCALKLRGPQIERKTMTTEKTETDLSTASPADQENTQVWEEIKVLIDEDAIFCANG